MVLDTGKSVSSFKDFIVASRNARNTFFWRYVVKGETDSILDSREGMEKKMERYKKEGDDKQVELLSIRELFMLARNY